jgi:hypothetical protein
MANELPDNIREFSAIAGIVLAQLYRAFPEIVNIDLEALAVAMGIDKSQWREEMLPSGRRFNSMQAYTIGWLNSEDYIRAFGASPSERVVLTARGLVAMNALPLELGGKTVGTVLNEAVEKDASRDYSKFGDLIGGLLGGFAKSLGSG